ncbi:golgin subfamily A member 2-like [Thomomys bottae]
MSEPTRQKKLAAGKKLLQEYQQRNGSGGLAESKKKKKSQKGGSPKTIFIEDGNPAGGTVRAAKVKSGTGPHDIEDCKKYYQHWVLALEASRIQNQQLCHDREQLRQEKKDLQDQQGKEKEEMACVHEALKTELEQHKLPTQMWISEKSDLQSALAHVQQVARERALEQEDLTSRLQAAQQHVTELERTLSAVSTTQNETEKNSRELMKDLNKVKLQLQKKTRSCEDLEDENTELQERLEALRADMKIKIRDLQQALEEREELERQLNNMKDLASTLKLERDTFAEDLRVESSTGKERIQQLLDQVSQLREEKEQGAWQVLELESKLGELRKQLAEPEPPAGLSQVEQQLQAQVLQLQKELKKLEEQLHTQVEENQTLDFQNLEQQQRLWILEKRAEEWDHTKDRRNILETLEKEHETMRCTLVHNRELKEQLGQLQDALQKLSVEKEELTSLLHSEQQVKKHLQEKLEQREEELEDWREVAEIKSQAARELQELRDQSLAQLQELRATCEQHLASHQQLTLEKEALQQHLRRQTQLLEQLKQGQMQNKLGAQTAPQTLQDTLRCLEATKHENEQLQAQLSCLAFPTEGESMNKEEERGKEASPCHVTVPEDVDNPHTMWDFYHVALSVAESKKVQLSQQLQEQQAAMDHQSQVDELQQQCSQLAEHMAAMEASIICYKEQMAVLDELYEEKDKCVRQLSQEKSRKKEELQELLLRLAGESAKCQDKTLAAAQTFAAEAPSDASGPVKMKVMEELQGLEEMQLVDNVQPAQAEAREPKPRENPTAEKTTPLLPTAPHHQEPAGLDHEPASPFFSRLMQMTNLK